MLYFSSPYYRSNRYSGANKRFEEIIYECDKIIKNYKVIVVNGNTPPNIESENCLYIPKIISRFRVLTWVWLNFVLLLSPKGIVVNDFKPIPFLSYFKHTNYLLIHDLRKVLDDKDSVKGLVGLLHVFMFRLFPKIITVSNYSKKLLVENCGVNKNKIIVSYNGISSIYTDHFIDKERDIDLLYVAHFESRKRHSDLLNAVIQYPSKLKIVLVGVDNGEYSNLSPLLFKAKELGHNIVIMSGLSEFELIELYRRTKVYVFPSELEGFGMPLIEAISQGCKIVCSDLDVFKEICGNNYANLFKLRDIDSLLGKLALSLDNSSGKTERIIDERFLWNNIAKSLLVSVECKEIFN